jgi:hypothetical protein
MVMKNDEGGEVRPPQGELGGSSFDGQSFDELAAGLADGTITRARAIKLAGAALVGSALTLFWPAGAEGQEEGVEPAGRRERRRRRRRRERRRRRARARRRHRIRRFRNVCRGRGDNLCRSGNTLACCDSAVPINICANVLNNPACVTLEL